MRNTVISIHKHMTTRSYHSTCGKSLIEELCEKKNSYPNRGNNKNVYFFNSKERKLYFDISKEKSLSKGKLPNFNKILTFGNKD